MTMAIEQLGFTDDPGRLAVRRNTGLSESSFSLVTYILIAVNVLTFIVMLSYKTYVIGAFNTPISGNFDVQQLLNFGANYGPYTIGGQYWRLVSSLFLHQDAVYLAWNLVFLWGLGLTIERSFGRVTTLSVYLLSGVGASVAAIQVHPTLTSQGASGAVAGMAGFAIAAIAGVRNGLTPIRRFLAVGLVVVVALEIVALSLRPLGGVDNATHIAGFLIGVAVGLSTRWVLSALPLKRNFRWWSCIGSVAATIAVTFGLIVHMRVDLIELHKGQIALDGNNPAAAVPHLQKFVLANPRDAIGHSELGYAYTHLNRLEEAANEYRYVLEVDPKNVSAQYDLARVYTINHPDQAIPLYRVSLPRLPQKSDYLYNFATALKKAGNLDQAESVASQALALDPNSGFKKQLYIEIEAEKRKKQ
jgi:membrane associated rhomboid family serine protease